MQTSAATGPFTLNTDIITQITTSIYELSTVTFNDDTNAYTTVDVIQSALTKTTWCTRFTPTYSALSSSQAKTEFVIIYNTGEHIFPIKEFSATATCENPIWKYTGFYPSNSQQLSYSTDMIQLDSYKGYNWKIKINSNKAPGMYRIKVKGTLPNNLNTIDQVFDIQIIDYQLFQP